VNAPPPTFLARLQQMPELVTEWGDLKLWPTHITAIRDLEKSLAANKPRALAPAHEGLGREVNPTVMAPRDFAR
jgi:type I restriction enzyme R subunit